MLEINGLISGTLGVVEIARAALTARDNAKIKGALQQAESQLGVMTSAVLQLQSALAQAQQQYLELKAGADQRARYVLHEVAAGCFCYVLNPSLEQVEPAHYVCQLCLDGGVRSVLRFGEFHMHGKLLQCAVNERHTVSLGDGNPLPSRTVISRGLGG